jgi:hypothetical protein
MVDANTVFDGLVDELANDLPHLLVLEQEPVGWLFLDAPDAGAASIAGSLQAEAVDRMGGTVKGARDTTIVAWFANPAAAIGTWLTLAAWTDDEVRGGLAYGYSHRADLVRLVTAEAAALANSAAAGELWINFELTRVVDLNHPRFRVEKVDQGALIPTSCKLKLHA